MEVTSKDCTYSVPLDVSIYLPVFLANNKTSFNYYKQVVVDLD